MTDNNKILELLLKKWELLWNHYKLQDEMMEKRRNLLWIIQSFIFAAWYYSFLKSIECIYLFKILSYLLPIFGIIVNIVLYIVLKRHYLSILIDEIALRDVELQYNSVSETVKMDRFIIDKKILFDRGCHSWKFAKGENIEENKFIRFTSQRFWLNKFIPILFISVWLSIFIIYGFF